MGLSKEEYYLQRYNIHYVVLDSSKIINLCGPELEPYGWSEEQVKARKEKAEHKVNVCGIYSDFFIKLEKSILEQGYQNPITVTCGLFTDNYKEVDSKHNFENTKLRLHPTVTDLKNLLTCEKYGGSRLYMAHKHKLFIPCIVSDFTKKFNNGLRLYTIDCVKKCFNHPPSKIMITHHGVKISNPNHIHLK